MTEIAGPSWYQRHGRKLGLALLALTFLLVVNAALSVLGVRTPIAPWRPRSSLMLSGALFINAALAVWRGRSVGVIVVLVLISLGLLIASAVTTD